MGQVAMKSVIDNVAIHAIEYCLIAGISDLLSPSHVLQMDQELVRGIAAESRQNQALREQTQQKMVVLQAGLDICRVHANRQFLNRTGVSESHFIGSHRPMKRNDPEDVEALSDDEQLYRETVENAYTGLPESIIISSALELVPPPDHVELPKSSPAFEPVQATPVFSFNTIPNPLSCPTGGSNTSVSTKAKKSKKDAKA
ncbi:hypothetical protein OEA41_007977 [Lepraria neglecta]|uniref:GED domain-containing protein n=1 Tax=Lepraria neglecta TaxID=209136 RepID=A0AAE0DNL1_9LECA|nr:hypothetical protein OEA41_007977 [Lepraria neglecta]